MKTRRKFLQLLSVTAAATAIAPARAGDLPTTNTTAPSAPADDRAYWLEMLRRVAEPVLTNLAENELKERMPIEAPANTAENRRQVTHLEAFGRMLAGLAPWLELADKPVAEVELGKKFSELARQCLANATDPAAADFMNFTTGGQPLVDAAFLAHALLRAKHELWEKSDSAVQQRVIACLQKTRAIKPGMNNWLLFAAMVETFLASVGVEWREEPVDFALQKHEEWYKGDGLYGDGADFHWDYYNSFVIQPMLLDVLEHIGSVSKKWDVLLPSVRVRARRYAAIQERLISPDGSYPVIGRSIAYRCGAFQLLGQMALRGELPAGVKPAQVRGAITAVIRKTLGAPNTFDAQGWLRVGLAGHQPGVAESYISTGSLYLCSMGFLPLGLPAENEFWSAPAAAWTQQKIWSGENFTADHALASAK